MKVLWYICIFFGVVGGLSTIPILVEGKLGQALSGFLLAAFFGGGGWLKLKALKAKKLYIKQLPDRVISKMKSMGCEPKSVLWTTFSAIGIDDIANKFCVVYMQDNEPVNPKIYRFSDIVKTELVELNDLKTRNNGSFVGGVMGYAVAGPLGMLIGSNLMGSSDVKAVNRGYEMKIVVNDLQHPTYSVGFNSKDVADHWYGLFTAVSSRT